MSAILGDHRIIKQEVFNLCTMFAPPAQTPFENVFPTDQLDTKDRVSLFHFQVMVSFSAIRAAAKKRDQTDEKQGGCAGMQVLIR